MQSELRPQLPLTETFRSEYLHYYGIVPLDVENDRLRVAAVGIPDPDVLDDLRRTYRCDLDIIATERSALEAAIRMAFASAESTLDFAKHLDDVGLGDQPDGEHSIADTRDLANQPPVIRFVNLMIREAYETAASDIHLEATRNGLRIRLRIDGLLTEVAGPPPAFQAAVISRLKLLADLDISERRAPQDGRIKVQMEARELDLRVSTIPTFYGESMVLRLLDRGGRPVALTELGMEPQIFEKVTAVARQSHGLLLSTGPTGSGKTTTLYAALALRKTLQEKIITVEDPIEYHLEGVSQVPVHSKIGMSFAAALRSILRQDPDVVMIGEMRDADTAAIAIQAALTGHLVYSTLHTNDAVSAVTRLKDLGLEPYLIAATLEGVLAQRLARRTCEKCRTPYRPSEASLAFVHRHLSSEGEFMHGRGCEACRNTGYRGRVGLFEFFLVDDDIRRLIARGVEDGELRRAVLERGMSTLEQDACLKISRGIVTVEEAMRVLGR